MRDDEFNCSMNVLDTRFDSIQPSEFLRLPTEIEKSFVIINLNITNIHLFQECRKVMSFSSFFEMNCLLFIAAVFHLTGFSRLFFRSLK